MVWNIQFQIAGLILTVVCASIIFAQKRLEFWAERAFARLLLAVIFSIVCDILSVFAINSLSRTNEHLVEFICEVYLFSIVLVSYLASRFAVAEITFDFSRKWQYAAMLPLFIAGAVYAFLKTGIYLNPSTNALYTMGIPVLVTYAFAVIYIVSTILMTVILKDHIPANKRKVIHFSMFTWILAALIQGLYNQLLIVTFAMAIVCIYIYCKLENPENHLDVGLNVFNKYGFNIIIEENRRLKKKKPVIAITIFNANTVFDIFGGKIFEEIKKSICDYLKSINNATVFRVEDGIYTLILNNDDSLEETVASLRAKFSQPWEIDDTKIATEVGITYIEDVSKYSGAKEIMDLFYYFSSEANRRNQDVIRIDEDELQKRKRTLDIKTTLEWALVNDGVCMFYQPIYDIEAGIFSSMEALVRIRDENDRLIMPNEFIEYAEQNGMILKLGEAIFRKVCEFIQREHLGMYGIDYVEVNLSVVQCMQGDLADTFMNIMGEYQIPPHMINLEITETAAINTHEILEKNMNLLRKYGTTFSLDDYGSGYSNLTYIVGMPLKIIKIDRSLAIAYGKSEKARVVVEYTIEMVHRLGMEVVVEGIEDEEQYMNFKKLGVEYIQGYYFSKPLPQDRVLGYVQEWM